MNTEDVMKKFEELKTEIYKERVIERARRKYKKIYPNGNFDRQLKKKEFDAVNCLNDAMIDQRILHKRIDKFYKVTT